MSRSRTAASALATLGVLAALVACAPGAPAPTPTSGASGTPTASATPDAAATARPDRVWFDTEYLEIGGPDDDFATLTFDYLDDPEPIVEALSLAFGSEPAIEDSEGGLETAPYRAYSWPGVVLYDDEGEGSPTDPDLFVAVSAPSVGGIPVYVAGFVVGDPFDDALALQEGEGIAGERFFVTADTAEAFVHPVVLDPAEIGEPPLEEPWRYLLAVYVHGTQGGPIGTLSTPARNWGV